MYITKVPIVMALMCVIVVSCSADSYRFSGTQTIKGLPVEMEQNKIKYINDKLISIGFKRTFFEKSDLKEIATYIGNYKFIKRVKVEILLNKTDLKHELIINVTSDANSDPNTITESNMFNELIDGWVELKTEDYD